MSQREILSRRIEQLKPFLNETLHEHCEIGLYTLKFHLLGHVVDNLV